MHLGWHGMKEKARVQPTGIRVRHCDRPAGADRASPSPSSSRAFTTSTSRLRMAVIKSP